MGAQAVSYQLLLQVREGLRLEIGALGPCRLPAGLYVYTGSARRGLEARIARHRRREKPRRWHIDWLTTHPAVEILAVLRSTLPECELNRATAGEIPVPGFGASDCRTGCGAHLKWIGP
ncbi:MAG: GIY-YIG nuclease family protein [Gammaproteobacteria bacterium]|nr:MAG: GIY-YIG nuclease family protein [Gammaproteobacteria bacterium]